MLFHSSLTIYLTKHALITHPLSFPVCTSHISSHLTSIQHTLQPNSCHNLLHPTALGEIQERLDSTPETDEAGAAHYGQLDSTLAEPPPFHKENISSIKIPYNHDM